MVFLSFDVFSLVELNVISIVSILNYIYTRYMNILIDSIINRILKKGYLRMRFRQCGGATGQSIGKPGRYRCNQYVVCYRCICVNLLSINLPHCAIANFPNCEILLDFTRFHSHAAPCVHMCFALLDRLCIKI